MAETTDEAEPENRLTGVPEGGSRAERTMKEGWAHRAVCLLALALLLAVAGVLLAPWHVMVKVLSLFAVVALALVVWPTRRHPPTLDELRRSSIPPRLTSSGKSRT